MKLTVQVVLLLFHFAASSAAGADSEVVDLSIFSSTKPGKNFKTLVIPIKRVHNLIVIEARIDSLVGNFILDSGSPYLILNKTYFRNSAPGLLNFGRNTTWESK